VCGPKVGGPGHSDASVTFGFYHWNMPFTTIVEETRDGVTKKLLRAELTNYHLPLCRACGAAKPGEEPAADKH
jgi:hypothetical protein